MNILLIPNLRKEHAKEITVQVVDILSQCPVSLFMGEHLLPEFEGLPVQFVPLEEEGLSVDFIIAIGGDGTIIGSSRYATAFHAPILGVNVGRLGFLASVERGQLSLLKRLTTGEYTLDKRMLLDVAVLEKGGALREQYLALNDAVFSKGAISRMIELDVRHEDTLVGVYRADGIIFSTPTGSTAYSLSTGGPIIDPDVKAITMTPISPHLAFSRAIVFSDSKVLRISANTENINPIYLTIDGQITLPIAADDVVVIKKAKAFVSLVNFDHRDFREVLNEKIVGKR